MLIILTIFAALLTTAILLFAKRRSDYLLQENKPKKLPDPSGFRPLFEPAAEELRAVEREEELKIEARKAEEAKRAREEQLARFEAVRKSWRGVPSKKDTIELLFLASQSERGKIYFETANEVIEVWKNGQIAGLSADDLSQLLESHFWLLPAQERTSGAKFSLQEEIASLRRLAHEDQ
jgi:hypothetical protein